MKAIKYVSIFALFLCVLLITIKIIDNFSPKKKWEEVVLDQKAARRSFPIEIQAVGELEAARSTSISSSLRGDLGKIIYLIADGTDVKTDDILVKLDPTPFEEQLEDVKKQIKEQESKLEILDKYLKWETYQVEHEIKAAEIEVEAAKLEINKLILGDGPIEEMRLKTTMEKSKVAYEELKGYIDDLMNLEGSEFLSSMEIKLTQKKLQELEEAFHEAKAYYDNFINYTHPMQIKKAETALNRSRNKYDEMIKSGGFKIAKAQMQIDQANQEQEELQNQLKNIDYQMSLSVIKAPSPGIVVLKEDFRNGQKRKPRIGDIVVKNQSILDLPYLEKMFVTTKVREIDLFKIQVGTSATVTVDAYPELTLAGKIQSIGVLAYSDLSKTGDEKYFQVIVKLDASDLRLRPGMTARVLFHANHVHDKIAIPIQAVFEFYKKTYCFVKKGSKFTALPIQIGLCNDLWAEIKSGLNEGAEVLLSMPPLSEVTNADLLSENSK